MSIWSLLGDVFHYLNIMCYRLAQQCYWRHLKALEKEREDYEH